MARLYIKNLENKTSLGQIRKAIDSLPHDLDGVYDQTIDRINSQPPERAQLAQRILTWVAHRMRYLSFEEVQIAVAIDPEMTSMTEEDLSDEKDMLSVCCGLVELERDDGSFRFSHYTVQEYFTKTEPQSWPPARHYLAKTCLTCWLFRDPLNVIGQGDTKPDAEGVEYDSFLNHKDRFIQYAVDYWGDHARGEPEESLKGLILSVLPDNGEPFDPSRLLVARWGALRYSGFTAVQMAVSFRLRTIVQALLELGHDLELPNIDGTFRSSPLAIAMAANNTSMVKFLLSKGADASAAMTAADEPTRLDILRLLLEAGRSLSQRDRSGQTLLHLAARCLWPEIVEFLLKNKADVNAKDRQGKIALHTCMNNYSRHLVKGERSRAQSIAMLLLEHCADVNHQAHTGVTPVHLAVKAGRKEILDVLRKHGANLHAADKRGLTLMHYLSGALDSSFVTEVGEDIYPGELRSRRERLSGEDWGNLASIGSLLLREGVDIDAADNQGRTALHFAFTHDMLNFLLDYGADAKTRDKHGRTALHHLMRNALADDISVPHMVQTLLSKGVGLNETDSDGRTASHFASSYHKLVCLMDHGADPESKDNYGISALECPITRDPNIVCGNIRSMTGLDRSQVDAKRSIFKRTALHVATSLKSVQSLLKWGADVSCVDKYGETALHYFMDNREIQDEKTREEMSQLLLDAELDVNHQDHSGQTALFLARSPRHMEFLIEHGADVLVKCETGGTALHAIMRHCFIRDESTVRMVELLISKGLGVNEKGEKGLVPPHTSARARLSTTVCKTLLERGVDIEAEAIDLSTPLNSAANSGSLEDVRLLFEDGADIEAQADDLSIAVHLAARFGSPKNLRLLLEHGADIKATTDRMATALHFAAGCGSLEKVRLLLEHGADPMALDADGDPVLAYAAEGAILQDEGYDPAVIDVLLEQSEIDSMVLSDKGWSALHYAAFGMNRHAVKSLLRANRGNTAYPTDLYEVMLNHYRSYFQRMGLKLPAYVSILALLKEEKAALGSEQAEAATELPDRTAAAKDAGISTLA